MGISLISIFAFGWLLNGDSAMQLTLGVVNADTSGVGGEIVSQLEQSGSLKVVKQNEEDALTELRAGHRDAVIVMGASFGNDLQQGHGQMKVYYNQNNQTTLAVTRQVVQSIIAEINSKMSGHPLPLQLQEEAVSVHNLRTIDFLIPGMLGMMIMWTNINTGSILVLWRERGTLRRLAATPLNTGVLLSTQMLTRLLLSIVQAVILILLGVIVFNVQVVGDWLMLMVTLVLGVLCILAMSFGVSSIAKNAEAAQGIGFLISFPMMFLGGTYFSVSNAPDFLKPVINIMPLTHLNEALRQIINNGASWNTIQFHLLILAGWVIVGFLFSMRTFRWSR
jgi:ABC-2 type transport system permease protein